MGRIRMSIFCATLYFLSSFPPAFATEKVSAIEESRNKGLVYLGTFRSEQGFYEGRFYSDISFTAQYLILLSYLGISEDENRLERFENYLVSQQLNDGSWSLYPHGPSDIGVTTYGLMGLVLARANDATRSQKVKDAIQRAVRYLNNHGGFKNSRSVSKIFLALAGQFPWEDLPAFPLAFFGNIQKVSPIDIFDINWQRTSVAAYAILRLTKPRISLSSTQRAYFDEVRSGRFSPLLHNTKVYGLDLDSILGAIETFLPSTTERLAQPVKFLTDDIESDGSLSLTTPSAVLALIAFKSIEDQKVYREYKDVMLNALRERQRNYFDSEDRLFQQFAESSVWDTSLSLQVIRGNMVKALTTARWLLTKQILTPPSRLPKGGWAFERNNHNNPDNDCTAEAILALLPFEGVVEGVSDGIGWAVEFLLDQQRADGGWAAFDKNSDVEGFKNHPFEDSAWLRDPSANDITCHVLEALGKVGYDYKSRPVQNALRFLKKRKREIDGGYAWSAIWGVNYIYATSACLKGFHAIALPAENDLVVGAVNFLLGVQNKDDGGWGEVVQSDYLVSLAGKGPSRPTTTGLVLDALLGSGVKTDQIERGIQWLLKNQDKNGQWDEDEYPNTMNFPGINYAHYELYPTIFSLMALKKASE